MAKGGDEIEETAAERELAQVSVEQWNDYNGPFRDFENKFIADVNGGDNPQATEAARREMVAGKVNADVAVKTPAVNPLRPLGGGAMRRASQSAAAQVQGEANVRNQRAVGLGAVVSMGRGQASDASLGYANLAQDAVSKSITDAATDRQESQAVGSAVMQGLGGAAAIYGNWNTPNLDEQRQINLARSIGNQRVSTR